MGNLIGGITGWTFLNEPAWRWGVWTGMIILFLIAWGAVLRHM